jgi:hypothetical protein
MQHVSIPYTMAEAPMTVNIIILARVDVRLANCPQLPARGRMYAYATH